MAHQCFEKTVKEHNVSNDWQSYFDACTLAMFTPNTSNDASAGDIRALDPGMFALLTEIFPGLIADKAPRSAQQLAA